MVFIISCSSKPKVSKQNTDESFTFKYYCNDTQEKKIYFTNIASIKLSIIEKQLAMYRATKKNALDYNSCTIVS